MTITNTTALNYVNGEWSDNGDYRDTYDPATGEVIGRFARASEADVVDAIRAAKTAFQTTSWRHDRRLRSRVLNNFADRIDEYQDRLIEALALNNGKIVGEATFEVSMVASKLRWWAAMALTEHGRAADMGAGRTSMVLREPVGVAGIIVPFNSPIILAIRSLAPALAAGTTTVLKFPEETALVNSLLFEVIAGIPDLPDGVINALNTDRKGGAILTTHPDIAAISFTGSSATGRKIAAEGAATLKRIGLELGGKTPMIVFDSADIESAIPVLTKAITVFAGQFCMAGSRVLVQANVADKLIEGLKISLSSVRVGPAADLSSDMGPLISRPNVDRVDEIVRHAIDAGAEVIVRGGPSTDPNLSGGAFYEPTLLKVSDQRADIIQKETFGPVLTVQVFEDEDEAVTLANDCEYGLSASIWSRDIDQPLRVAKRLECGTVWINSWAAVYDEFEEGGYKASGAGRLNGLAAMDEFLEYKHIAFVSA